MRIGGVGLLAFYGRGHSDCGVQPALVVPPVSPYGNALSSLLAYVPSVPVDELVLQGEEERLSRGVVQCLATCVSEVLDHHTVVGADFLNLAGVHAAVSCSAGGVCVVGLGRAGGWRRYRRVWVTCWMAWACFWTLLWQQGIKHEVGYVGRPALVPRQDVVGVTDLWSEAATDAAAVSAVQSQLLGLGRHSLGSAHIEALAVGPEDHWDDGRVAGDATQPVHLDRDTVQCLLSLSPGIMMAKYTSVIRAC